MLDQKDFRVDQTVYIRLGFVETLIQRIRAAREARRALRIEEARAAHARRRARLET